MPEKITLNFAGLLRQLREEARLTQEELAEAAGLSPRTVSDLERGVNQTARRETAALLGRALHLNGPSLSAFVAAARGRVPAGRGLAVSEAEPAASAPPTGPVPRQLPADVDGFTGRTLELAELEFLLPTTEPKADDAPRPVLISAVAGTGGVGKTALAVHWAHRVAGQFPDGQLYVNLRGYDLSQPVAPGQALAGFLRALGVGDADIPLEESERAARYRSLLSGRRVLIVLDNAVSEEQVRPLLPGTGPAMVIVTSRDSLAGLVARDGAHRLDLDLLPLDEAVALLRTLVGPRADADPGAAEKLAILCARLPLALRVAAELAISRPDTPLATLAAELADEDSRLEWLDAGGDPRVAVASVFSWSYRRLSYDAAKLFRVLGLHPSTDWDQYAAAALTSTSPAKAGRLLAVLVRAHLVQPAGSGRYGMHNLLRAYAAGLAASQDGEQGSRASLTGLFDYYLAACAAAMDCLAPAEREQRPSPPAAVTSAPPLSDLAAARAWLSAELPTLTAVADYTASHGWPGHTTRLAATLFRYLNSDFLTEGLAICGYALRVALDQGDHEAEAYMLAALGAIHLRQGRHQQAADLNQQAVSLARAAGDQPGEARALLHLGNCYATQGSYPQTVRCYRRALALFRALDDHVGEARALRNLGSACLWRGRYQQAADFLHQALAVCGQTSDFETESAALFRLGEVGLRQGRYREAADYLERALAMARNLGMQGLQSAALATLGEVCLRQGHYDQAIAHRQQALTLAQEVGAAFSEARALNGMGQVLLATGRSDQAVDYHRTALILARRIGDRYQQAYALTGLGQVSYLQGQPQQAAGHHRQALTLYQETGGPAGQADAGIGLGQALLATGEPEEARSCHVAALAVARRIGDRYQQAQAHQGLAAVCQATGETGQADRHWRRAVDLYTELGVPDAAGAPVVSRQ